MFDLGCNVFYFLFFSSEMMHPTPWILKECSSFQIGCAASSYDEYCAPYDKDSLGHYVNDFLPIQGLFLSLCQSKYHAGYDAMSPFIWIVHCSSYIGLHAWSGDDRCWLGCKVIGSAGCLDWMICRTDLDHIKNIVLSCPQATRLPCW